VAVFERILLQIFKDIPPLISPLGKEGYEGGEAKAPESRVYRGARMSEKIATYQVPIGTEFAMNNLAKI
jgi:hypothetical protein